MAKRRKKRRRVARKFPLITAAVLGYGLGSAWNTGTKIQDKANALVAYSTGFSMHDGRWRMQSFAKMGGPLLILAGLSKVGFFRTINQRARLPGVSIS